MPEFEQTASVPNFGQHWIQPVFETKVHQNTQRKLQTKELCVELKYSAQNSLLSSMLMFSFSVVPWLLGCSISHKLGVSARVLASDVHTDQILTFVNLISVSILNATCHCTQTTFLSLYPCIYKF